MGLGCGPTRTDSSLAVVPGDAGAAGAAPESVHAQWSYRSGEVDVDADLTTTRDRDDCRTEGRLRIDSITAAAEVHYTEPLACTELELTASGDIRLRGLETGHDWSTEPLEVDRDRELIRLGPWTFARGATEGVLLRAVRSACGGCSCPRLVRRAGDVDTLLELGRDCD
jgi:hypothetical protein